jgi:hypothetical protein
MMNALHRVGEGMLISCSLLTRPARQALCQTFSFVERLDPGYAQAYYCRAQQQLFQCEQYGKLMAGERAGLHADTQYWHERIEALEYLLHGQGYVIVNPLRPHWESYRRPQHAPHTWRFPDNLL